MPKNPDPNLKLTSTKGVTRTLDDWSTMFHLCLVFCVRLARLPALRRARHHRSRLLGLDLLDRKQRVEHRRAHGLHAPRLIGDTDDEYLNDIEARIFVSGGGELGPSHKGHVGEAAGGGLCISAFTALTAACTSPL